MERAFRTVEIDRGEASSCAGLVDGMFRGEHGLLIVRGAIPAADAEAAAGALDRLGEDAPWVPQVDRDPRVVQLRLLGESLTPNVDAPLGPDLARYLDRARGLEALTAGLPGEVARWTEVLAEVLGDLGAPGAVPAVDSAGRRYTPGTLRHLPPGCGIPVHVGNFFLTTGGYRHLRGLLDTTCQLSYFFTLRAAAGGGELEVFDLCWGDPQTPWLPDAGIWDGPAIVASRRALRFRPGAGDLLLFDGGRHYHRVTEVLGDRARWTLGGFIGRALGGGTIFWN